MEGKVKQELLKFTTPQEDVEAIIGSYFLGDKESTKNIPRCAKRILSEITPLICRDEAKRGADRCAEYLGAAREEARKDERERAVDECFDYFAEIVRSDKVIVNLLDQLQIKRRALKREAKS